MKARLVGDGRTHNRSMYPDRRSLTVSVESQMVALKLTVVLKKLMVKIDVSGAYLNALADEEMYV